MRKLNIVKLCFEINFPRNKNQISKMVNNIISLNGRVLKLRDYEDARGIRVRIKIDSSKTTRNEFINQFLASFDNTNFNLIFIK